MRVTKAIREYIEGKVNDIYKPRYNALRADYDAKKNAAQKELEAARERWEAEAKAIVAAHGLSVDTHYNSDAPWDLVNIDCRYGDAEWRPVSAAIDKARAEKNAAIQNIIVEMELGGNREKLESMLAAIGEK